jgi:hypothetical protein
MCRYGVSRLAAENAPDHPSSTSWMSPGAKVIISISWPIQSGLADHRA